MQVPTNFLNLFKFFISLLFVLNQLLLFLLYNFGFEFSNFFDLVGHIRKVVNGPVGMAIELQKIGRVIWLTDLPLGIKHLILFVISSLKYVAKPIGFSLLLFLILVHITIRIITHLARVINLIVVVSNLVCLKRPHTRMPFPLSLLSGFQIVHDLFLFFKK